jgi:hypothetical protein
MKSLGTSRYALTIGAVSALLAGCGGSQPPIGAPSAMPPLVTTRALGGTSRWGGRSDGDLLFVLAGARSTVGLYVRTYLRGKFVFHTETWGAGLCSDHSGNVWVANGTLNALDEFTRAGEETTIVQDKYGPPWGCSVDPTNGAVAAINSSGQLVVNGSAGYSTSLMAGYYCTYDDQGNLFGVGLNTDYKGQLVELPHGGSSVENITLNQSIQGTGAVQWDGKYLAVQAAHSGGTVTIYRLAVSGSNATIVGTTQLVSPRKETPIRAVQFWIQGNSIAEPIGSEGKEIAVWRYPEGGHPIRLIKRRGGYHIQYTVGVTVSVAPK